MKFLFLFLFISTIAGAGQFMPPNDLWRQDCLTCKPFNQMTQDLFNRIVEAGKKSYQANADSNGERLVVNPLWSDSTVNADCCRGCVQGEVTVNMYGGMARRAEMNPEGFALVLGHELSHAYGGQPYYPNSDRMSAEGQSDYEGAKTAYAKIAALVPELQQDFDADTFIKDACARSQNPKTCEHSLTGGLSLGTLLATLSGDPAPQYETPDQTKVSRTETSYPKTTQCRLDTYFAGTFGNPRPACWFKSTGTEPTPTPYPTPYPTPFPTPNPTPNPTPAPTPEPSPWPTPWPTDPWDPWGNDDWNWPWPTWPW